MRPPHIYVTEEAKERDNRRDTTDQKLVGVAFKNDDNPKSAENDCSEGDQKFCLRQVDRAVWRPQSSEDADGEKGDRCPEEEQNNRIVQDREDRVHVTSLGLCFWDNYAIVFIKINVLPMYIKKDRHTLQVEEYVGLLESVEACCHQVATLATHIITYRTKAKIVVFKFCRTPCSTRATAER